MESKKRKTNSYSKSDLDIKNVIVEETKDDKYPIIDRKATQAEIDKVKQVKDLLATGFYNDNQVAGMTRVPLEKVRKIKNGS